MDAIRGTEHECSIGAEILYTSFKWTIQHWSLLYDFYKDGVETLAFDITASTPCKCKILFKPDAIVGTQRCTTLVIDFFGDIDFLTMQINVALVDKDMQKLLLCQSNIRSISQNSLFLKLPVPLTKSTIDNYLQNDTLILHAEFKIVTSIVDQSITTNTLTANHTTKTRKGLEDLYESKDLCDAVFCFKDTGKTLTAHKVILAANSNVFRAMFTNDMKEQKGPVDVVDIDESLFEIFLNYMYTGKVNNIKNVVEDLISVADKYEVIDLIDTCEKYMAAHLNDANAVNYLVIGHRHSCATLEKMAIEYIKHNTHIMATANDVNLFGEFPNLVKRILSK